MIPFSDSALFLVHLVFCLESPCVHLCVQEFYLFTSSRVSVSVLTSKSSMHSDFSSVHDETDRPGSVVYLGSPLFPAVLVAQVIFLPAYIFDPFVKDHLADCARLALFLHALFCSTDLWVPLRTTVTFLITVAL